MNTEFFRPTAAGLLVPEPLSREREVWTKTESKLIDRAFRLLAARGIQFALACATCRGTEKPLQMRKNEAGERIARCGHKDRVLSRML